jgi:hypothetical protein
MNGDLFYAICSRPECSNGGYLFFDFTFLYFLGETAVAGILSLDLFLRCCSIANPLRFLLTPPNWVDIASVLVYYLELKYKGTGVEAFMFSTADPSWLFAMKSCKILRIIRLGRDLPGAALLMSAFGKAGNKLAGQWG